VVSLNGRGTWGLGGLGGLGVEVGVGVVGSAEAKDASGLGRAEPLV
jgi:hypothetical protein